MQALILLDFMLSLTPKAKGRLADLTNKSVLYGFVLSDEDVSNTTIDRPWTTSNPYRPNGQPKCERRSRNTSRKEREANSTTVWSTQSSRGIRTGSGGKPKAVR